MLYLPKADPGHKNFEHENACFVHLVTYAPNFEKVGDILVSACPYVCVCVCVCVCVFMFEISS